MTSLAPSHKRKYPDSEASNSAPKRLKSPTGPVPVTPKPSLSWFSVLYHRMVDNALPKYSLPLIPGPSTMSGLLRTLSESNRTRSPSTLAEADAASSRSLPITSKRHRLAQQHPYPSPSPSNSLSPIVARKQLPSSLSEPYSSVASSSRHPITSTLPSPPSSLASSRNINPTSSSYAAALPPPPPSRSKAGKERSRSVSSSSSGIAWKSSTPRDRSWLVSPAVGSVVGGGEANGEDLATRSRRGSTLTLDGRKGGKKKGNMMDALHSIQSKIERFKQLHAGDSEVLASADEKSHSELQQRLADMRHVWDPSPSPMSPPSVSPPLKPVDESPSLRASLSASQRRKPLDASLKNTLATSQRSRKDSRKEPIFMPEMDALRIEDEEADVLMKERLDGMKTKVVKLPTKLTDAQEAEVAALLAKGKAHTSRCNREQVTFGDLERLFPRQWANDEIINYYGTMIQDAADTRVALAKKGEKVEGDPLSLHYFSTFFFAKLESPGYEKAKLARWTKKVDIFAKDLVLIPINQGNSHWTSAVINFKHKRIEAYDSMGSGYARNVFEMLKSYLQFESMDKKKVPFDFEGWDFYSDSKTTPQQLNGFDCGIFTCQILESVSRGGGFGKWTFGQENMPYLRRRMMLEIYRMKLLNHPTSEP